MIDLDLEKVRRALAFYTRSPDGQYDLDIVVPILREWLEQAELWEAVIAQRRAMWDALVESTKK